MRAIVITRPGGPEVLELRDAPAPRPGAGQLRVRVAASGVNRADLLQRRGGHPPPPGWPQHIPGLEYAGVVDVLGPEVSRFHEGDRVMGLVGGGGYAELVVVNEAEVMPVPDALELEPAAAVPEAFLTAHDALFTQMQLLRGETVLVHAVGSGVGTVALQLAKAAGTLVIGTGRSAWKLQRAIELGLDWAVVTGPGVPWPDEVLRETGGRGVDGVLDLVGGGFLAGNIRVLAPFGRLVVVGLVSGRTAELDLGTVLSRRLRIIGTAMRSRSPVEKHATVRAFQEDGLPLLAADAVRPIVDRVFPPEEAAAAHARMESNENFGKILLRW